MATTEPTPKEPRIWRPFLKESIPGQELFVDKIISIQLQNLVGEYDTPDQVPEWRWIQEHASFAHLKNGTDGVWEFVLNVDLDFDDVPAKLRASITTAKWMNVSYLLFHQGT